LGPNDLPTLTPNPYAWAKVSNPNTPYFI
jgi:hypothetical protein